MAIHSEIAKEDDNQNQNHVFERETSPAFTDFWGKSRFADVSKLIFLNHPKRVPFVEPKDETQKTINVEEEKIVDFSLMDKLEKNSRLSVDPAVVNITISDNGAFPCTESGNSNFLMSYQSTEAVEIEIMHSDDESSSSTFSYTAVIHDRCKTISPQISSDYDPFTTFLVSIKMIPETLCTVIRRNIRIGRRKVSQRFRRLFSCI